MNDHDPKRTTPSARSKSRSAAERSGSLFERAGNAFGFDSLKAPKVPSLRSQRGSVARSICGPSAVVMPIARYSADEILANSSMVFFEKVAARPMFEGQREMSSPSAL